MNMQLPIFENNADVDTVVGAMRRTGAAVVANVLDADIVDAGAAEMKVEFDARGKLQRDDFTGHRTLRCSSVLGYAPTTARMIGHPWVLAVADEILKPHCLTYRIGSTTGIEILPGEDDQALHTDDSIYPLRIPGLEFRIGVLWALDDFTEENGATRVVLGSHTVSTRGVDTLGEPVPAEGVRAVLHGIPVARRRRQSLERLAHGSDQHLCAGLATPGGEPVPRRAAGDCRPVR